MEALLRQLADICDNHRWQPKWVIVPSHALGRMLGERLVRQGVNWANLRFIPPAALAIQIAGPRLAVNGVRFLDEDSGPALVLKLLLDLPADVPAYFRPLADQPGMAEALWSALRDTRLAGLAASDLTPTAFPSPAKHAEVQALATAYEQYLASGGLADTAATLREATRWATEGPIHSGDVLIEVPPACTSLLERQFLDALPMAPIPVRTLHIPELREPRRSPFLSPPLERRDIAAEGLTDARRLPWLLASAAAPPPAGDGTLEMFRAGGSEAEVEEVFRRIVSRHLSLDTVEIACAQPATHAGLLWEKAQRHGWPVTLQMGVPGTFTRPVRALLAFCDWIESDFYAELLVNMLQSGDLDPAFGEGLSATAAGRIVRRSGATTGRDTYASCLSAEAAVEHLRAEAPEVEPERRAYCAARAAQVECVAAWIGDLLTTIPTASAANVVRVGDLIDACAAFDRHSAIRNVEDGVAAKTIVTALEALQPLADFRRPASFALELVRNRLRAVRVCTDLPRPGALHVSSLASAGQSGRPFTFVVGLEERAVFPRGLEDPVLLDAERSVLSPVALTTSQDRIDEAVYASLRCLASLEGNVCLSFSCRDLRNGRETFPSWILLHAMVLTSPGAKLAYQELNRHLGEPVSVVPRDAALALTDADWWLSTMRGAGRASMPSVLRAFEALGRGATAETSRGRLEFSEFDGFVPRAGPVLDICNPARAISASTLESFAACPFRYFLQYGLDVVALESREDDADVWLQPPERGRLLHTVYARFLREVRDRGRLPAEGDRDHLQQIATETVEEMRAQIPPPSEGVFARDAAQIRRDLDFFLTAELEQPCRMPVAIEVPFGYRDEDNPEPLARPEPVVVDLGDGRQISLRGRIDRIDRFEDGRYEVIDYKTGFLYRPRYSGTFAGGTLLQHALYSRAAREVLLKVDPAPRVASSIYYFPTERGAAQRASFPADLDVAPLLRDLAATITSGSFPQAVADRDCRRCDYSRGCAKDGVAQSAAKLQSGDTTLAAYRSLVAYA
jgi:ATP-dependent helicase/nuclease subunit B